MRVADKASVRRFFHGSPSSVTNPSPVILRTESRRRGVPLFWAAHRHPDFWREPMRFDPDRFSPAESKGRHSCAYTPFSAGPHTCIGNNFSLVETQLLIAQILGRFDLAIAPAAEVKPVAMGTVRPSKPVLVRFTPRFKN